eukprot:CAMPEP_0175192496 /NCGR_PEP_ID=MMETSP0093-20121207/5481_1 /TAXON_ID=311494 /ORGANISM="Alexandrium monilatum, Strain CCMP3105" /LENGTH=78 /DNA_ID=CAMNT_0016485339 /DNA_START=356 /DNA_END=589 /DNA_ORIENTATION=-
MNNWQDWSTHPGALLVMMTTMPIVVARFNVWDASELSAAICRWTSGLIGPPPVSACILSSHEVGRIVSSQSKMTHVSC